MPAEWKPVPACKQCGGAIHNKFLADYCAKCIESAVNDLTIDDIASVVTDLERRAAEKLQQEG